ncbi:MAG: glycosyltransferase family 2 protein [Oscillospiraceae bacterium]|nr:glycosyltransferase family 2 protein [Oscillospiraceae bacterium]
MRDFKGISGVPDFSCEEYSKKSSGCCVLIPVINENGRLKNELGRALTAGIDKKADIIICDGGSSDGSVESSLLKSLKVNALLVKKGPGRQGAQLRMGFWWALRCGYERFITIDGNDKDSIESVPLFIEKLGEGADFVQGSRFIKGGAAVNTPISRLLAVRLIHAPVCSLAAGFRFTDTTNAFRGYSRRYIESADIFREVFSGYELLAYFSTAWAKLGLSACEVPVRRAYPEKGAVPTKISPIKGSFELLKVLFKNARGGYDPK